jgi:hypothetical protein
MVIRPNLIIMFCGLVAVIAVYSPAFAAQGKLDAPALSMAKDYPEADYQKIKNVLERKDCTFLGGDWLNAHTSLRYGGDTIALNKFIERLSLCPNLKVHVNFFRPSSGGVECDWMVTQHAPSNKLVVRINLASEQIKIEDLHLPPVKAEKVSD